MCPDCLRPGLLTGVPLPIDRRIKVPFCEICAARQVKWSKLGRPLVILAGIIAFAVTLCFDLSKLEGWSLATVLALPTVWLTDYRDRVVRVRSRDAGKVTFEFKRTEYAHQFEQLNKFA